MEIIKDEEGRITNYPIEGVLLEYKNYQDDPAQGSNWWMDVSPEAEGLWIGPNSQVDYLMRNLHEGQTEFNVFFCFRCSRVADRAKLLDHDCEAEQMRKFGFIRYPVPLQPSPELELGENPWQT